jgi:hypothetical protein
VFERHTSSVTTAPPPSLRNCAQMAAILSSTCNVRQGQIVLIGRSTSARSSVIWLSVRVCWRGHSASIGRAAFRETATHNTTHTPCADETDTVFKINSASHTQYQTCTFLVTSSVSASNSSHTTTSAFRINHPLAGLPARPTSEWSERHRESGMFMVSMLRECIPTHTTRTHAHTHTHTRMHARTYLILCFGRHCWHTFVVGSQLIPAHSSVVARPCHCD